MAKLMVDMSRAHIAEKRISVHKLLTTNSRDEYRYHSESVLQDHPYPDLTTEENWKVVKSCIISAADKTIGRGKRKQSEWSEEDVEELIP